MNLNDILANISDGIQKTLSKQNLDVSIVEKRVNLRAKKKHNFYSIRQKIMQNFGEAGDQLKELGQTLINKAQATAADLANRGKKDEASP